MIVRRLAALALTLPLVLMACSSPIRTQLLARSGAAPLVKLAVVGVSAAPKMTNAGGVEPRLAANVVTGRLLEALYDLRTFQVVPPSEVSTALGASTGLDSLESNVLLHGTFGVQAVLRGKLVRFQQRLGGPRGATRPAAVSFTLELSGADGLVIWRGSYEEVQQSLADDPGSFSRARQRNFRWVTAETLAQYGARELIHEMPGTSASWK